MPADIFDRRRILVCVGAGGVGKTTTAAAMALRAALSGRRALVLTIDPARRLANSLGIGVLGHDVQRVPDQRLDQAAAAHGQGRIPGGELHAMMLDQKRAFDEIVESHASDPAAVKRIMANPVYDQISSTLAGAQEYAAMAKLHDFDKNSDFDTIIVDTPPTVHALDFLDAPEKLTMAIDSPAIEWFRKIRSSSGGWSVLGNTGGYIIKRLAKFVGSRFIDDLAVFFTEFNDVLGGFRARAEATFAALRQEHVGFLVVASPEPMTIREALFFHDRLVHSDLEFEGFIVNRVHRDLPVTESDSTIEEMLGGHPAVAALGYQPTTLRMASEALLQSHKDLQILASADQEAMVTLADLGETLTLVPFLAQDVHDLDRLATLGGILFGDTDAT